MLNSTLIKEKIPKTEACGNKLAMGLRMCTRTRFRFLFLFRNLVQGGHSSSKQGGSASLFTSSSTSLDITILYFFYFADSLHTVMLG